MGGTRGDVELLVWEGKSQDTETLVVGSQVQNLCLLHVRGWGEGEVM